MKSYMRAIMIFNKSGEVRRVNMEPGVNILLVNRKQVRVLLLK